MGIHKPTGPPERDRIEERGWQKPVAPPKAEARPPAGLPPKPPAPPPAQKDK
jgi:hypothetical protein